MADIFDLVYSNSNLPVRLRGEWNPNSGSGLPTLPKGSLIKVSETGTYNSIDYLAGSLLLYNGTNWTLFALSEVDVDNLSTIWHSPGAENNYVLNHNYIYNSPGSLVNGDDNYLHSSAASTLTGSDDNYVTRSSLNLTSSRNNYIDYSNSSVLNNSSYNKIFDSAGIDLTGADRNFIHNSKSSDINSDENVVFNSPNITTDSGFSNSSNLVINSGGSTYLNGSRANLTFSSGGVSFNAANNNLIFNSTSSVVSGSNNLAFNSPSSTSNGSNNIAIHAPSFNLNGSSNFVLSSASFSNFGNYTLDDSFLFNSYSSDITANTSRALVLNSNDVTLAGGTNLSAINTVSSTVSNQSTIIGGSTNTANNLSYVLGGNNNLASGENSIVVGSLNVENNIPYSLAGGFDQNSSTRSTANIKIHLKFATGEIDANEINLPGVSVKQKLDTIESGAQVNVPTNLSGLIVGNNYEVQSSTGSNTTLQLATTTEAGLLSLEDKQKLNGIESGATQNSTDSYLLNRVNHTGTQSLSTISDAGLLAAKNSINNSDWAGTPLAVSNGGTGETTVGGIRTLLSINNVDNVSAANLRDRSTHTGTQDISTINNLLPILNAKADLVGGTIPSSQLPSYVDDVIVEDNFASLPAVGESDKIYITRDENEQYRWSANSSTYIKLTSSPGSTDAVPEGTTNLYFTEPRARSAMTGAISTFTSTNAMADRVIISNGSGKLSSSSITSSELLYLNGATSNIQTQINSKENSSNKVTNFTTVNNTLFPTTEAVANSFVRSDTETQLNVGRGAVFIENHLQDNQSGSGITLRPSTNPDSGNPEVVGSIFSIRSSGNALRFWVGQSVTSTGDNDFQTNAITATSVNATTLTGDGRDIININPNNLDGVVSYLNLPFSSTQVSNWDIAYGWGNHADVGYAVSGTGTTQVRNNSQLDGRYLQSESDPTVPSHVKSITTTNISNWNEAHGWGNFRNYGLGTNGRDITNGNCNDATDSGFYRVGGSVTNTWPGHSSGDSLLACSWNSDYAAQLGFDQDNELHYRYKDNGVWNNWVEMWHTGNFDPTTKANVSHTHAASDINSGTFDLARIPTITTAKTDFANQDLRTSANVIHNSLLANSWVESGSGDGGPALTTNDGGGNANLTFNHTNNVPSINGNAGRITVNKDSTAGAAMTFLLGSNVTGGVSATLNKTLELTESTITFANNTVWHEGNLSQPMTLNGEQTVTGRKTFTETIRTLSFDDGGEVAFFEHDDAYGMRWRVRGTPGGSVTGDLTLHTNGGLSTLSATGGSQGAGTINCKGIYVDGTSVLTSVDNSSWSGTDLSVANGGTGRSNLGVGEVLIGNGTSAINSASRAGIDTRSSFPPDVHQHQADAITSGVFSFDRLPISSSDVVNWNAAFSWGNHNSAGYLSATTFNNRQINTGRNLSGGGTLSSNLTLNYYRLVTLVTNSGVTSISSNFDRTFIYNNTSGSEGQHFVSINSESTNEGATETILICRSTSNYSMYLQAGSGVSIRWAYDENSNAANYAITPGETVRLVKVTTNYYLAYSNVNTASKSLSVRTSNANTVLQDSDNGGVIIKNNVGFSYTYTVPDNATTALPIGYNVTIINDTGSGDITVAIENGNVNLFLAGNSSNGDKIIGTRGQATLIKTGTNMWRIVGAVITV